MFRIVSLLVLMILAVENQGGKQESVLFKETFDNAELGQRGWYDGTACRIAENSWKGNGCIEYEWILNNQKVQGSSQQRHLFKPVDAVYIRFYLRLSEDWEWSGRNYHPHLTHFLTTENSEYHGPAASHLTLYIEPVACRLRLAATDIQNENMPHGLTQGALRGGYNGIFYDSKEELFVDDKWHCIEAYFRLNTLDNVNDQPNRDGIVRGWFDGKKVIDQTDVILRSTDFPDMMLNQFLMAPYFGPGLLNNAQQLWIDELVVGTERIGCLSKQSGNSDENDIKPYTENPRYWQYKGSPVLLLGGTGDDNLFQIPGLEEHLDLLQSVGGNYIRNTMSSRDSGNSWPFYLQQDGSYDLELWNEEYWNGFESLLKLTDERDIIIQIEVWDRFDFSRDPWKVNPFNPDNNVNYTEDECGMEKEYPKHPSGDLQPFFHSVPDMPLYRPELELVRKYQEKFVDKLLSYSLNYGNVLYCMDNETSTPPEWGKYWMEYIQDKAGAKEVYTSDMFDKFFTPHQCASCRAAIEHPETYEFLDVSQINSRNFNRMHWDTLSWILQQRELYSLRPVNCVKVYGGENSTWGSGSNEDGIERFVRDVIGGCAAVRHHRPLHGNGLNVKSQASIKSVRKIESMVKLWEMTPHMELLSDIADDEAYLTAKQGEKYVILFPEGGKITLDLSNFPVEFSGRWISIGSGSWGERFSLKGGSLAEIAAPGSGGWFAVLIRI